MRREHKQLFAIIAPGLFGSIGIFYYSLSGREYGIVASISAILIMIWLITFPITLYLWLFVWNKGAENRLFFEENTKKAKEGDATAQFNLGWMYYKGRGVTKDFAQALYWYRKAAENWIAEAQKALGAMYAKGQGVTKNYAQAYMWFNLAAAQGDEEAIRLRDYAVKTFTPSQIEEGQRLIREWLAAHE